MSTQVAITPIIEILSKRVTAASKHMVQSIPATQLDKFGMQVDNSLKLPTVTSEEREASVWRLLRELGIYKDEESFELLTSEDSKEGDFRAVFCDKYSVPVPRFKRMWKILTESPNEKKSDRSEATRNLLQQLFYNEKDFVDREKKFLQEEREKLELQELLGKDTLNIAREALGITEDEVNTSWDKRMKRFATATNKIKEEVKKLGGCIPLTADKNKFTSWKDKEIDILKSEGLVDVNNFVEGAKVAEASVNAVEKESVNKMLLDQVKNGNWIDEEDKLQQISDMLKKVDLNRADVSIEINAKPEIIKETLSAISNDATDFELARIKRSVDTVRDVIEEFKKMSGPIEAPVANQPMPSLQDFRTMPYDEVTAKKVESVAKTMNAALFEREDKIAEKDAQDIAKYTHCLSWGSMSDEKLLTEYAQITSVIDPANLFTRKYSSIVAEIERRAGGTRPCIIWNTDATVDVKMSVRALRECRKKEHYSCVSTLGWKRLRKAADPVNTVYVFKSPVSLTKLNYVSPCEHYDDGKNTCIIDWSTWTARSLAMIWAIAREEDKKDISTLTRMDKVYNVLQQFEKMKEDGFTQSLDMHPEYAKHLTALVEKEEKDETIKTTIGGDVGVIEEDILMNLVGEMHARLRYNQIYEPNDISSNGNSFSDPMENCASSLLAGKLDIVTEVDLNIPKIVKVIL